MKGVLSLPWQHIGTFVPALSRDDCRLVPFFVENRMQNVTGTFRTAFLAALNREGLPLLRVAELSGVSYEQLKKLKQRPNASTNVEDAAKLSSVLGMTIEQVMTFLPEGQKLLTKQQSQEFRAGLAQIMSSDNRVSERSLAHDARLPSGKIAQFLSGEVEAISIHDAEMISASIGFTSATIMDLARSPKSDLALDMLRGFDSLSEDDQKALISHLRFLVDQNKKHTQHD